MSLPKLTDLRDVDQIKLHRPLLIAHRGGVIAPGAPENSLPALRLAAEEGYHLVELDVRASADGVPFFYHGIGALGHVGVDCGVDANISQMTAQEIASLRYRGTDERILPLATALTHCAELGLGVMLDFKDVARHESVRFVEQVNAALVAADLQKISMTISHHPLVERILHPDVLRRTNAQQEAEVRAGAQLNLHGWFWFDHPDVLDVALVSKLQTFGALLIPTVNSFRYPKHSFGHLEDQHIQQLKQANVDGFQIDSPYRQYVTV